MHFLLLRIIGFCVDNGSVYEYDVMNTFIEVFPLTAVIFLRLERFFRWFTSALLLVSHGLLDLDTR